MFLPTHVSRRWRSDKVGISKNNDMMHAEQILIRYRDHKEQQKETSPTNNDTQFQQDFLCEFSQRILLEVAILRKLKTQTLLVSLHWNMGKETGRAASPQPPRATGSQTRVPTDLSILFFLALMLASPFFLYFFQRFWEQTSPRSEIGLNVRSQIEGRGDVQSQKKRENRQDNALQP